MTAMGPSKKIDKRVEYDHDQLLESMVGDDPMPLFAGWFEEAHEQDLPDHNAAALATIGATGPSCRMVLLREYDHRGFSFFTNYKSRKGRELLSDPRAAMTFFWPQHERQIRITGKAHKVSAEESDEYFATRPRESRIGAWASQQSEEVRDRETLDAIIAECNARFAEGEVPRPEHWGGFRLVASHIEFWQGRPGRVHDRLLYTRKDDGTWTRTRLQP